jgi:small subunit ribosomal protein S1
LIHYKDLSWSENDSELEKYKKNQLIKFKILEINNIEEKIRLGIKQLGDDPFEFFMNKNVSDIVTGIVQNSAPNGIYLQLGKKNLSILIKKNQLAKELENQRPTRFVKGDKLDALITELDKEKRKVSLSIKALEEIQTKEAVKKYGSKDSGGVLGEILGPLLVKKNKKKK